MKNLRLSITLAVFSALLCGKTFAQTGESVTVNMALGSPQAVTNHAITNPDILVVSGKILDATNMKPIKNARINSDKFGDEMVQASVDEKGNYALALNKKELGEPIRIIFKIDGYKKYVIKTIDKTATFVDANIFLQPLESDEKSNATVKYILNEDPFNPLVIKLQ
jgi:hypothetical protein